MNQPLSIKQFLWKKQMSSILPGRLMKETLPPARVCRSTNRSSNPTWDLPLCCSTSDRACVSISPSVPFFNRLSICRSTSHFPTLRFSHFPCLSFSHFPSSRFSHFPSLSSRHFTRPRFSHFICLFFSLLLTLSGCQSPAAVAVLTHRTDSVYIDKLLPYPLPSDSASIRARIACDENGRIALRGLEMANTKNVQLHFSVDSIGKVMADMKIKRDTLYLPSKETIVVQEIERPVAIAAPLSRWERFKMETGGWAIGLLSGLGVLAVWYAFRKRIWKFPF